MTVDLALEYIPRRMCEMGYGNYYIIRFRHLLLQATEKRELLSHGQLCILVEPTEDIRVESDAGLFDLSEDLSNELQYEHQGNIVFTNLTVISRSIRFIQVIPKNCKQPCR